MVVDLREPMPSACRNHHDIAGLELIRHTVPNVRSIVPRTIELDDGSLCSGTTLPVCDIRPKHKRRRSIDDVIDLAYLIMLGNRVRIRLVELATMDHPDSDVRLSNLDIAHLLIGQPL